MLHDRHMAIWGFAKAEERLDITGEEIELAERCGDRDLAGRREPRGIANLLEVGDIQALEMETGMTTRPIGPPAPVPPHPAAQGSQAAIAGRFDVAEQLAEEVLTVGQRVHHQGILLFHFGLVIAIRFSDRPIPRGPRSSETDQRYLSVSAWRCAMSYALVECRDARTRPRSSSNVRLRTSSPRWQRDHL